ncbi:MAG: SPOR domain-containing protein [Pseudomonadota bacterium]|jgi:cell division protein FtsN
MARAKQASRRRSPARPAVPRALWVMVGAVVVLFAALLAWLGTREPQPETVSQSVPAKESAPPSAQQQEARAVAKPPAKEVVPPPPRYEFYNMLPAQKVEVPPPPPAVVQAPAASAPPADMPPVAAPPPAPDAAVPAPSAASTTRYELQVGSFRRYEEADRRKAELAMLGFASTIQSANVSGETWHRVKIGPLPEAEARKARDRLKAVGMNPLLVKQGG